MNDYNEANSQLFADEMIEPVQKWLDAGADPAFISTCLRLFADIIDRKAAEKVKTND